MVIDIPLHDETIYRRTIAGQHTALLNPSALEGDATRLLLIVNGYTPVNRLLDLLGRPRHSITAIRSLLAQGLIEPVA